MPIPRGFVPYRSTGSSLGGSTRRYHTRAKNAKQIFIGDLVVAVSGATGLGVTPYAAGTDGTAAAGAVLGVVEGIFDANRKPYVFSQPTNGPLIPTATNAYVDVNIDPNQTYLVAVNGTASAAMMGRYMTVDTTVMGTATGMSPMMVGVATTVNPIRTPVTADQTPFNGAWPLYCLEVTPWEDSVVDNPVGTASYKGTAGSNKNFVEVKITQAALNGVHGPAMRIVA